VDAATGDGQTVEAVGCELATVINVREPTAPVRTAGPAAQTVPVETRRGEQ
jgi:hypothetical protein